MRFYVAVNVDETNFIVSSTDNTDTSSAMCVECQEPIVGVAIAHKSTVFSNRSGSDWWAGRKNRAIGSGLAGIAGCAVALLGSVSPKVGQAYIVDTFMVVVVG